jgi:acyl-phosphate glycerol 3-phosphate acyltransferase
MWLTILGVLAAYLIGSIPFGYLIARAKGVDIFKAGSGNIGATNVSRVLGRKFGLIVFALDVLKGALPTAAMRVWNPEPAWSVAAGLAAMLGHLFPLYLRFHGGKGVATGFGVVAVLLPVPAVIAFVVWLAVLAATRYVSLASLVAVIALVTVRFLGTPSPFVSNELAVSTFCLATGLLVIAKHRANIGRLMQGKENRVADSTKLQSLARVLHVLALGVWVGGGIMFSFVVAPSVFATATNLLDERRFVHRTASSDIVKIGFGLHRVENIAVK